MMKLNTGRLGSLGGWFDCRVLVKLTLTPGGPPPGRNVQIGGKYVSGPGRTSCRTTHESLLNDREILGVGCEFPEKVSLLYHEEAQCL